MKSPTQILLAVVTALALCGAVSDPGVHVRVDLEGFQLVAVDARRPDDVLVLPIATGSPEHPTPTGRYHPREVVRNPGWKPSARARAWGARPMDPSANTPMGVAKIPLTGDGFVVHGGADPIVIGKPVSLGCIRLADADMLALLDWLDRAGALAKGSPRENGEIRQALRRPVAFDVR